MTTDGYEAAKDRLFGVIYELQEAETSDADVLSALEEVLGVYKTDETLTGNIDIEGIKRCYVDLELKRTCKCGAELVAELNESYLSYPKVGEETTVYFECSECEEVYEYKYLIEAATITLRPVNK